jgi:hypothetical protein
LSYPRCLKLNKLCSTHKGGKYKKWSCGNDYDPYQRHKKYIVNKHPCLDCSIPVGADSQRCWTCQNRITANNRIGQKLPEEWCKKISEGQKGEKGPNWKGGVTPIHKRLRRSMKFRRWREAVFKRDDYTCQFCKERGGELHPDHIKPFALFPRLRFDINNGRTLCVACHRKTPTWGMNKKYQKNSSKSCWTT